MSDKTEDPFADWYASTESWTEFIKQFEDDKAPEIILAILCFVIGVFGIAANSLIIRFYSSRSRRKALIPALYVTLSSTDLVVCVTSLLHFATLSCIAAEKYGYTYSLPAFNTYLSFLFTLTATILRLSAYVNIILIVVRTINITQPFYLINKTGLVAALLVFPVVVLPPTIYDAYVTYQLKSSQQIKIRYMFRPFVGEYCIQDIWMAIRSVSRTKQGGKRMMFVTVPFVVTFITSGAPFIVAAIISLVCLGINAVKLRKTVKVKKSGASHQEREITITIAILSIIFAVSTAIFTVFITFCYIKDLDVFDNPDILRVCYITSTVLPFLSSAANAAVLISRSKVLREFVVRMVRREGGGVSGVSGVSGVTTQSVL